MVVWVLATVGVEHLFPSRVGILVPRDIGGAGKVVPEPHSGWQRGLCLRGLCCTLRRKERIRLPFRSADGRDCDSESLARTRTRVGYFREQARHCCQTAV